jgi:excisionase family DNA binding protein
MTNLSKEEADKLRLTPPSNLTLPEAAAYLRVAASTLWDLKNRGKVRCARIGKRLIFQRTELDRVLSVSAAAAA